MARSLKAVAIVLKSKPVGENHRGLCMFVRGTGLVWPLAFGVSSRKSAMRAAALPYNRGMADLHYDGVHRRWRLNAFDVIETHDGLRENLNRFYAAAGCAEILLCTDGSGGELLFDLAAQTFLCISRVSGRRIQVCRAVFMWLFLSVEGLQPNLKCCGVCGAALGVNNASCVLLPGGMFADLQCSGPGALELPCSVLQWLGEINRLGVTESLELEMELELEEGVMEKLVSGFIRVLERLIERPLKTGNVSWGGL